MSDTKIVSVKITGDESGLKAALDDSVNELKTFSDQTDSVLQKIEKNTGGLMLKFQKITIVAHGAIKVIKLVSGAFSSFMQDAQNIDQMSRRLGVARNELEMLKYVAEQSGLSFESVAEAMKNYSNTLGAANLGDEGAKEKLFNVGIDSQVFDGKDMAEQFDMLADHIAAIEDPTERARVAMELFGESGFQLLPMLEKGSKGLEDLKLEAIKSGSIMGEDTTNNALKLREAVAELQNAVTRLKNNALSLLVPILTKVIGFFEPIINGITAIIRDYPGLCTAILVITMHIRGLTLAVKAFETSTLVGSFWTLVSVVGAVAGVFAIATDTQVANTKAKERDIEVTKKAAEVEKKRADAAKKAAEEAKKAQDAQKAVVDAENSLANAGKSSAQKEVEKIDEDITTFKSNWHTRKNWLRQQANKRKLTKEEQTELDSMTPERYYDYINAQKRRQNEIRSGLSHHDYQPESSTNEEVRAAKDNLATLRANGASSDAVAQAETALKAAEMKFSQEALRSSGWEKESARTAYENAKNDFLNYSGKDEFEKQKLYQAMIDAQQKSKEADTNFTRLAEQNYKMHEAKMPEYEYKSVGGTFNAFAVAALGADIPKQQLEVLQQVAGKMDDIINNQQEAGVFA